MDQYLALVIKEGGISTFQGLLNFQTNAPKGCLTDHSVFY